MLTEVKNQSKSIWVFIQKSRPYRAFSRFSEVGGTVLAAGMSFQALFAVFAALWVGFGILAQWLRGREELIVAITEQINTYVPDLIAVDGDGVIPLEELLDRSGLNWGSAIASISLIWVAIAWFTGTRRAIRLIFGLDVKEYRNPVFLKVRDFIGAITFFVAILLSAALTVVSSGLFSWVLEALGVSEENWFVGGLGVTLRYGAMFVLDVLIIMGIHRFLAEVHIPFRRLLYGSIFGGLGMLGLKALGNLLLGGATSNPLLATFAVIIGLLLWFNLVCRVLLLTSAWIASGLDKRVGLPDTSASPALNLLN